MPARRQMHLGLFILGTGSHIAGWRYPGAVDTFLDIGAITEIARTAERGKFDLLFMGDNLYADPASHPSFAMRLEPLTMMAAVAVATRHIGLGATASTTYGDPFTTARVFASLDHISGGRAAWNAVTTSGGSAGLNFGKVHPDHASRYEVAQEFVDVVTKLWDAWDDGALVADHATGQYFDTAKIRPINHEGRFFRVKGPLNIGRTPQGRPIILQAGGSDDGLALAARTADIVFSVVQDREEARANYAALKARLAEFGRAPDTVTVLPGVMPVVGRTDAEAREILNRLQSYVDSSNGLQMLSNRLGQDMTRYDLDGPIPDLPQTDTSHAFARTLLAKAKRENMTLRDLYNLTSASRGHWVLAGSPTTIADTLQDWFETEAGDGFNIMPPYFHKGFEDFVDLVVPELQRRGLFRREYAGPTLRDHFGLPRPPSVR